MMEKLSETVSALHRVSKDLAGRIEKLMEKALVSKSYPTYKEGDDACTRMAACIDFEMSNGGNAIAAAKAIMRDVERGHIFLKQCPCKWAAIGLGAQREVRDEGVE